MIRVALLAGDHSFRSRLAEIALTQERRLGARITDPRHALSNGSSPFSLRFAPLTGSRFDTASEYIVEFVETTEWSQLPLEVDAVVLTASSASDEQLSDQLQSLRAQRGRALQPAGLPVFIESEAFEPDNIAQARFGSLSLHAEPMTQVEQFADLIRAALAAARKYRQRRERAAAQLRDVFQIVAGVALGFIAFAVVLTGMRDDWFFPRATRLVAEYRQFEGPPPNHLHLLDDRLAKLSALAGDGAFDRLSAADQAFVNDRLTELRRYRDWCKQLLDTRPAREARDREELFAIQTVLEELGQCPDTWRGSAGERYWARLMEEAKSLRAATDSVTDAYDADRRSCERLLYFADWPNATPPPWLEWRGRVKTALATEISFVSEPFTTVTGFPEVAGTIERGRNVRVKLQSLADIADALGLTGGPVTPRADTTHWRHADLPDAAMTDITAAATRAYQAAIAEGRTALADAFKRLPGPDSRERWLAALDEFRKRPTAPAWAAWVGSLQRLMSEKPVDPVAELEEFLRREEFPFKERDGQRLPDLWPAAKIT